MELNQINLIGRLVENARAIKKGEINMATFSLANNSPRKDNKEQKVVFIDCLTFNKNAENVIKYCHRGDKVRITGYLDVNPYKNKQGITINKYYIVVNEIEFLTPKAQKTLSSNNEEMPF